LNDNYQNYDSQSASNLLINNIIEAMKDERHDRVKYYKMMQMTDDPEQIKQIKFAYDDEIKHYEMFQQIYYELTRRRIDIPMPNEIEKYDTFMEAVQSSIEGENNAVDLYREIFSQLDSKKLRDMVFEIITDEQEHANRFIYLYSMLK